MLKRGIENTPQSLGLSSESNQEKSANSDVAPADSTSAEVAPANVTGPTLEEAQPVEQP